MTLARHARRDLLRRFSDNNLRCGCGSRMNAMGQLIKAVCRYHNRQVLPQSLSFVAGNRCGCATVAEETGIEGVEAVPRTVHCAACFGQRAGMAISMIAELNKKRNQGESSGDATAPPQTPLVPSANPA